MNPSANPEEHVIAEGMYSYTIDGRPRAAEMWRISSSPDGRSQLQALLGAGQQILFAMDVLTNPAGAVEALSVQIPPADGGQPQRRAAYHFTPGAVRGQVEVDGARQPIDLTLPAEALPYPAAISARFLLGRTLNLTSEDDQPLDLCVIGVPEEQPTPPQVVHATATVLGQEPVDLLMATISATHVLLEWPGNPPQHAWFDEHRFPIRWYWVGPSPDSVSAEHDFSLGRYAWF